jgi:putative hemolysin
MYQIVLVLALILLNGLFAMSELAVVSARKARLAMRAEGGDSGAARALRLAENPNRFLSAIQIGITMVAILMGVVGEAAFSDNVEAYLLQVPVLVPYASPLASALVVIGLGFVSIVLGELVPKRMALAAPEAIASRAARPLEIVAAIGQPAVVALGWTSDRILHLLGIDEKEAGITEEEVKTTIAEGVAAGAIAPEEHRMLEGVLRLADRPVRAIMTPRGEVQWIDLDDEPETLLREIESFPSSRIVVGRDGSIDEPLGIVQKKDLLNATLSGQKLDIRAVLRQPAYVPDGVSVLRLLDLLKRTPLQMAFVVDEFGTFEGIVTATDVLEAIAGTLPEEHPTQSLSITQREDGSYLVDGRTSLDELEEVIQLSERPDGDYHTVAGLLLSALGRIPVDGDSVAVGGWRFEVVDMDGRRIDKLLVSRLG